MMPTTQKGLSDWWNEETEYVFQRIERWAAFARGYNRLRSQRFSRGRMTMNDCLATSPGWDRPPEQTTLEPRFYVENHHRSRRRNSSHPEKMRINCCGTFNYQSNNHLDSQCLETYRYDHSIYFKTIGDIKRGGQTTENDSERSADVHELEESLSDNSDREQVVWVSNARGFEPTDRLAAAADDDLEIDLYARRLDLDNEDAGRIAPVDDDDDECRNGNDDFDYCRTREKNIDDNNNNNPDDDDEEEYLRRTSSEGLEIIKVIDVDSSLNDSRRKTSPSAKSKTLDERRSTEHRADRSRNDIFQLRDFGDKYENNVDPASSPQRRALVMM